MHREVLQEAQKINEMITNRLIERMESMGSLPWKKPWSCESMVPRNLITKKPYRGVNVFLLHALGYESPYFLSMKQVNTMGGHVRKGEKSCPVIFWHFVEATTQEDPDAKGYALLRYYRVFNVTQCDGLDGKVPEIGTPTRQHEPLAVAEEVVKAMPNPPTINHGCAWASYRPSQDRVLMPAPERFTTAEAYYSALFHELSHATGHVTRCARKAIMDPKGFGSHAYSQEELVAEMTAAFLCGWCGILLTTEENQVAYLNGWLSRFMCINHCQG